MLFCTIIFLFEIGENLIMVSQLLIQWVWAANEVDLNCSPSLLCYINHLWYIYIYIHIYNFSLIIILILELCIECRFMYVPFVYVALHDVKIRCSSMYWCVSVCVCVSVYVCRRLLSFTNIERSNTLCTLYTHLYIYNEHRCSNLYENRNQNKNWQYKIISSRKGWGERQRRT